MINTENDVPKYKKKKMSSTSKSKMKSRHKHEYVDCLFVETKCKSKEPYPYKSSYCKFCGKIGNSIAFVTVPDDEYNAYSRILHPYEVYEKYPNLEVFYVDDIFQKCVPIDKDGD